MSAVLAVIVLGGAAWFLLTAAGGSFGGRPVDSVDEFSRAMSALDPTAPAARPAVAVRGGRARPAPRTPAPRTPARRR